MLASLCGLLAMPVVAQPRDEPAIGLRCLQAVYSQYACATAPDALLMCDGTRIRYDDGRHKTHAEQLADPDLEDMMAQPYGAGEVTLAPAPDFEPGRVRYLPLFDRMYGATEAQVRAQLTTVVWLPSVSGRKLEVTTVNRVHEKLKAVSDALERLPLAIQRQAARVAGAFSFRRIAGTERKSAHSYGIAVDVAPALADYWRWREPGVDPPQRYRNRMPSAIVAAFEHEGFIWGGRWSHYDTMHFEYRPELLVPACRATVESAPAAVSGASPAARYAWERDPSAEPLRERVQVPAGYTRIPLSPSSFGEWLRGLPLRAGQGVVRLYDGRPKPRQDLHVAVVEIDVGKRDLQQCADAVMRLRAEYLFGAGRQDEICFRAVSGDAMPYASYRRGLRPPPGRASPWSQAAPADASWQGFRKYLDRVFDIANTASLARELEPVRDARAIEPGDVYIQPARGERFGHAVLVLDVAENASGERVFLIAQSYMPAQDIHVLVNPQNSAFSPWYRPPVDGALQTPEWDFPAGSLKRFAAACH
jgi:hypothetical protein